MSDGTHTNPVVCAFWSEAFDTAVERDRPVYCLVEREEGSPHYGTAFPSRCWKDHPARQREQGGTA